MLVVSKIAVLEVYHTVMFTIKKCFKITKYI